MVDALPPPHLPVLLSPPAFDPLDLTGAFARALRSLPVAAFILDTPDPVLRRAACEPLRDAVQTADVALLVADDPELAAAEGADGIHLTTPLEDPSRLWDNLGEEMQWGAVVEATRHAGMELADSGADYVAMDVSRSPVPVDLGLSPSAEDLGQSPPSEGVVAVLTWWAEMVEVPVMLTGWGDLQRLAPLLLTRPDFVAIPASLWTDADGLARLAALLTSPQP